MPPRIKARLPAIRPWVRGAWVIPLALATGCASTPSGEAPSPGSLTVAYRLHAPDGRSYLKQEPKEVRWVSAELTQGAAGRQALLNIAMLSMGVLSFSASPFSPQDLLGQPLPNVSNPQQVRNPVADDFVAQLQGRIDTWLAYSPEQQTRVFQYPVNVHGGHARLIHESHFGEAADRYRMVVDLLVFKRKESAPVFSVPYEQVDCRHQSPQPLPMADWAHGDYEAVRFELDRVLAECADRVVAELPRLLAN